MKTLQDFKNLRNAINELARNVDKVDEDLRALEERFLKSEAEKRAFKPGDTVRAILNGYEVEKSPEKKIREYFAKYKELYENETPGSPESADAHGVMKGIVYTLNVLGEKIPGVND